MDMEKLKPEQERTPTATWLRAEGAAVFALSLFLYTRQDAGWLLFAVLLLAPDLAMAGYLRGPRIGALAYNLVHTYAAPLLLGFAGVTGGWATAVSVALIWTAHIGMDRMLGYGLKLPTGFHDTHLGRIGPARREQAGA